MEIPNPQDRRISPANDRRGERMLIAQVEQVSPTLRIAKHR
jgi:hypothetical protein